MRTFQSPRSGAAGLPESIIHWFCGSCLLATWWLASGPQLQAQEPQTAAGGTATVDFQRDVRPILSDTCYKCHGPDEQDREAGLRLDTQDGLLESGAVVAGDLDASELFHRISSDDPDLLMPPPDSGRELTKAQRQTLRRWIEQGAQWQQHWSLVTPAKPNVPAVEPSDWCRNPIDHFILQRLRQERLQPQPEADRRTLIRRVTLDLTGLPPDPSLLEKHLSSQQDDWYEALVDQLLASPAYGEHMARFWLDAARYGDTHGLHLDNYREMWPYRDWVIDAFNQNLSYRDFTIQQLAGDMLPDATDDQKIASGFNRAHVTTSEGGSIAEEVYVRNVVDRVSTTGTVFMGLTVGCAQCHDHKFDPISQREFYQLFAFFNNLTDPPLDQNIKDPPPVMRVMDDQMRTEQASRQAKVDAAKQALEQAVADLNYDDPADAQTVAKSEPTAATDTADSPTSDTRENEVAGDQPHEFIWVSGQRFPVGGKLNRKLPAVTTETLPVPDGTSSRLQAGEGTIQQFFTEASIPIQAQAGDVLFADVYLDPDNPPQSIMLQFNDGSWEHRVYWGTGQIPFGTDGTPAKFRAGDLPETGRWVRLEVNAEQVGFSKRRPINGMAFTQFGGKAYWNAAGIVSSQPQTASFNSLAKWLDFIQESPESVPGNLQKLAQKPVDKRTEPEQQQLRRYFLLNVNSESADQLAPLVAARDQAQTELDQFNTTIPTTLISQERNEIKETFLLNRGEYDQRGDKVERATLSALPPMDPELPVNRLGFANWLVDDSHPLTARVAVNRFWQQLFGTGIVKTSEDFGSQGDLPSHPELLDYLAVDFREHDWDVKRLMKQLVMSATYRQSSTATERLLAMDPQNRLLARGPRFRLDAETLRDQALAISGLLNRTMGGPSVKPPQPAGLWFAVGYSGSNTVRFKADQGADKIFRRSVYTFWKRTSPPPQLNTFDAPSREECRVRRERTNTPLQALLLMNEPQYLEAARRLAERTIAEGGDSVSPRLQFMFETALCRPPNARELEILNDSFQGHQLEFAEHPDQATALVKQGDQPADLEQFDAVELAAYSIVANLILNMDEFVSKN